MSSSSYRAAWVSGLLPGLALASSLCAASALADQVIITDVKYTHSKETTSDSHYRVSPMPDAPKNWQSPVDYVDGSVHVKLVVRTKPSSEPTKFQVCFEGTPSYACTQQSKTYTAPGSYEWITSAADVYYGGDIDWSKGISKVALILKDTNNGKPAPENVGAQKSALYFPTDVEVTVTLISAGATFSPPSTADAGAPKPEPNNDAGALDAGGRPGPGPAGDAATQSASKDASAAHTASKDAGRSAGADAGRGDVEDNDIDGDNRGAEPDNSGCNVDGKSLTGGLPFGLLLAALSLKRRRRALAK